MSFRTRNTTECIGARYCFQTNYGKDAYSGPSTSFCPIYDGGPEKPPAHCNVNRYRSHHDLPDHIFDKRPRLNNSDFFDAAAHQPIVVRENLRKYIALAALDEQQEREQANAESRKPITQRAFDCAKNRLQIDRECAYPCPVPKDRSRPKHRDVVEAAAVGRVQRPRKSSVDLSLSGTLYLYRALGKKLGHVGAVAGRKLKLESKRSPSEKWQIKLRKGYAKHEATVLACAGALCA